MNEHFRAECCHRTLYEHFAILDRKLVRNCIKRHQCMFAREIESIGDLDRMNAMIE